MMIVAAVVILLLICTIVVLELSHEADREANSQLELDNVQLEHDNFQLEHELMVAEDRIVQLQQDNRDLAEAVRLLTANANALTSELEDINVRYAEMFLDAERVEEPEEELDIPLFLIDEKYRQ